MSPAKQEAPEPFDLRVHIRGKDGQIEKVQPYQLRIEGGRKIFARGGRLYNPDGTEIITDEALRARKEFDKRVQAKKEALQHEDAKKQVEREMEEKAIKEVNLEIAEEEDNLVLTEEEKSLGGESSEENHDVTSDDL